MTKIDIKPVHIDGVLYVAMGFFGSIELTLSSDSAYKYMEPNMLFWLKLITGAIVAGATSLKMYRSTQYADSQTDKLTPPLKPNENVIKT